MKTMIHRALRALGFQPVKTPVRGVRQFSAAQTSRLTADWNITALSPDSILRADLNILRARSRDLAANDPFFQKFLTMLKSNVLGADGITLKNKATDAPVMVGGKYQPAQPDYLANKLIEDGWYEWGKRENCCVTKDMTFTEACALALETVGTDGETLWRMVTGDAALNKFGFALQPIETDRIDTNKNDRLENGGSIRMGIEKDAVGRRVAVWLFDTDPNDIYYARGNTTSKRYDYAEFVHPFLMRRIGQSRGYPWAAVTMLRMKMLKEYQEAHLAGTRAAACKMGFLKTTGESAYNGEEGSGGGKYMDTEPGSIEELPPGLEFQAANWDYPNSTYGDYVKACLREVSAGLNVSYNTLANDLEGVNFSSGRLGLMDERENWKALQTWFAGAFNNIIFARWLEASLLRGALALELANGERKPLPASKFAKFNQPVWRGRRWQWVDPVKEVEAKKSEIRCAFSSPVRVISEMGEDVDEVLDEIAEFKKKAEERGLEFEDLFGGDKPEPIETPVDKPNEE